MNQQQESPQIEQTQSNSNLVISNPIKQNNTPVIILSVLLLISISVSAFFAYQTQTLVKELTLLKSISTSVQVDETKSDPTSNWNTYTNEKDSYIIKYPVNSDLTLLDCTKGLNRYSFVLVNSKNTTGCYGQGEGWVINSEGSSDCTSTESWKSVSEEININNVKAVKCTHTFVGDQLYPGFTSRVNVTFINQDKKISFDLKDTKYSELFDQILSTFKFTN